MRKNKGLLMIMIALCLTMVMTVVIAADKNTKAEASVFDYFKRVKLKDCIISLEYEKVEWTGKEMKPKVIVSYQNNELVENVDYMVEYKDNISAGDAKVKVRGIGKFRGKKKLEFFIDGINIKNECTYKLNGSSVYVYHKGELVDPSNYTISESVQRIKLGERQLTSEVSKTYLIRTTYTVTGLGKFYGKFSYVIEDMEYIREPITKAQ